MNIAVSARQSNVCYEDRLRAGLVSACRRKGSGEAPGEVLKWGYERAEEGLILTGAFSDRAREK